jgi:hypothetical protein
MTQLIKISGKRKQVFAILELLTQRQGKMTMGELQNWIAEIIKRKVEDASQ